MAVRGSGFRVGGGGWGWGGGGGGVHEDFSLVHFLPEALEGPFVSVCLPQRRSSYVRFFVYLGDLEPAGGLLYKYMAPEKGAFLVRTGFSDFPALRVRSLADPLHLRGRADPHQQHGVSLSRLRVLREGMRYPRSPYIYPLGDYVTNQQRTVLKVEGS